MFFFHNCVIMALWMHFEIIINILGKNVARVNMNYCIQKCFCCCWKEQTYQSLCSNKNWIIQNYSVCQGSCKDLEFKFQTSLECLHILSWFLVEFLFQLKVSSHFDCDIRWKLFYSYHMTNDSQWHDFIWSFNLSILRNIWKLNFVWHLLHFTRGIFTREKKSLAFSHSCQMEHSLIFFARFYF
jgi:hypothetical protein